ncbi:MAG: hypothetical protein SGPRY_013007 [Prymnesium sp.]
MRSGGGQKPTAEAETRRRKKPPLDSFQSVETAVSRAADKQLAVDTDLGLCSLRILRREHVRQSVFKDITSPTWQQREDQLDGEIRPF